MIDIRVWIRHPGTWILFATFFALTSCNLEQVAKGVEEGMYFDVDDYLKELGEGGFDTVRAVEKIVIRNGQGEEQNISNYNLNQEWELMRRNNINTKALQGKYTVDSVRMDGNVRIGYHAQDQSYAVDSLFVTKSYGTIRSVEWNQSIRSPITDTRQRVIFKPDSGLEVRKTIDPLLGSMDTFVVQLRWR